MQSSIAGIGRNAILLIVPTEDTIEEYDLYHELYERFGGMQAEQFWVRRKAWTSNSRYWWDSNQLDLTYKGKPSKAVLDMSEDTSSDRSRVTQKSEVYKRMIKVPTHPVLRVFSLVHHQTVWVSVSNMREYVYEEDIDERLILPDIHRRLIGALVSNLDVLKRESEAEDKSRTIRAKANSSIILAKGVAGT